MLEKNPNMELIAHNIELLKKKYRQEQNIIFPHIYYKNMQVLGRSTCYHGYGKQQDR